MDPEFLDSQSDESSDDSYDPSYNPKLGSGFLSVTKISEKMRKSQLKERRLRKQSKVSKCAKKLKRKVPTRQIVTNKPENLYKVSYLIGFYNFYRPHKEKKICHCCKFYSSLTEF